MAPATTRPGNTAGPLLRRNANYGNCYGNLWGRHRLLLRRIRLPELQLLFRLAVIELGYGTSGGYYPYTYGGGYPYNGYNNYYSYYTPTYGYNGSMVASVSSVLAASVTTTA